MWVHAFLNSEPIHNRNCRLLPPGPLLQQERATDRKTVAISASFSHEVAKKCSISINSCLNRRYAWRSRVNDAFWCLKRKQAQFDFIIRSSFLVCLQCLKLSNSQDDVHAKFAELLSDLNEADPLYTLGVANRLYGEQSYQFVKVCVSV